MFSRHRRASVSARLFCQSVFGFLLPLLSSLHAAPTSTATFTAPSTPVVRINEVLATNTRIANAGTFPDIIELHNSGATAASLAGWSLTDDPALPRKYTFPAGTSIPAGGYLTVYADLATSTPGLHTGFALDAEGDVVQLYDSNSTTTPLDEIRFGFQVSDLSISRTGAASNIWTLTTPTLGGPNAAALAFAAPDSLRINEWAGKIVFRLDHDLIELFNLAAQPVALGGVRLTDNVSQPTRFRFPVLSFIGANGFVPLFGADFVFGLDGDRETVTLFGENNEQIDQVILQSQPTDRSSGRNPDGSATIVDLPVPSPGISNATPFPAGHNDLLNYLRITEVMYDPQADSNASQYEFIELQNIGPGSLNLGGVRFTNGLEYEFAAGTTLAPGAFIVVVNDRSSFRSRYPQVPDSALAAGGFNGSLSNEGETLALTLPAPWDVHILRFRFEPTWQPSATRGGHSLVIAAPATATPASWQAAATWRASAAVNGSPAAADAASSGGSVTARLSNLSVRAALAASQTLIVGFYVDGGARNILVRASGPALAALGLTGTMADPRLELYNSAGAVVTSNDDWPASLSTVFPTVGAFDFPAGSRDAAFQQNVNGSASVHARGTGPGIVLVEAYDTGAGHSPRMINLSARNRVGTDDEILIAGFNIAGTGSKQLLIRGVGPKLAAFGVSDFLLDPKLEVYNSAGQKIAENDNWSGLAATFTAVGAFALDANSRDAALVTTLPPASYTVQVRGIANGTGEALIEIYELP